MARRRGLPIGNLTSQFFANVLLDQIDHVVKDRFRMKAYLRFVDDLAFFHDDKDVLWLLRDEVEQAMWRLRLRLNRRKSRVRRIDEGITFLGFTVDRTRLRLGPVAVRRARRRHRELQRSFAAGASWDEIKASLQAWSAHANHGTTRGFLDAVFEQRPFRREQSRPPLGGP
ncbi:MAG: RNA-directed DNA polymerase [Myxococcota bacterium]